MTNKRSAFASLALALTVLVLLAWGACGGVSPIVTHTPGTAPGTYTITLTGIGSQAPDNNLGPLTLDQAGNRTPLSKWQQ